MASITYNSFKKDLLEGSINLEGDTIHLALVRAAYTPDQDTHTVFDDITDESAGTGYVAGGKALANKAVTQDNTGDQGKFDADDVEWTVSSVTAGGAVLYKNSGDPATSPLIRYFEFDAEYTTGGTTFKISWPANGLLVAWP